MTRQFKNSCLSLFHYVNTCTHMCHACTYTSPWLTYRRWKSSKKYMKNGISACYVRNGKSTNDLVLFSLYIHFWSSHFATFVMKKKLDEKKSIQGICEQRFTSLKIRQYCVFVTWMGDYLKKNWGNACNSNPHCK